MFSPKHDEQLMSATKVLKSPEDIADSGGIAEIIRLLDAAIEKDEAERREASGKTASGSSATPPPKKANLDDAEEPGAAKDMIDRITAKGNSVDDDLKSRIEAKETEVTRLFDAHCAITEIPQSENKR